MKTQVDEFRSSRNVIGLSQQEAINRALAFLREDLKPFIADPALFIQFSSK